MAGSNLTETETYSANVVGPVAGDAVTAASVRVMGTSLANRSKYLNAVVSDGAHTIVCLELDAATVVPTTLLQCSGTQTFTGTMTVNSTTTIAGACTHSGAMTCSAAATFNAAMSITSTCTTASTGTMINLGRARRRTRVQLSVADHSVGPADGSCFELAPNASTAKTITLLSVTGQTAADSEIMEFIVPRVSLCASSNTIWTFVRESGTVIAYFESHSSNLGGITAQFEFVSGVWRLGVNSGWSVDSGIGCGVRADAGA